MNDSQWKRPCVEIKCSHSNQEYNVCLELTESESRQRSEGGREDNQTDGDGQIDAENETGAKLFCSGEFLSLSVSNKEGTNVWK